MNMFNNDDENEKPTLREILAALGIEVKKDIRGNQPSIRQMIIDAGGDESKLDEHPLYAEGYSEGYAAGKQEAKETARMTIKGLFDTFEDELPPRFET